MENIDKSQIIPRFRKSIECNQKLYFSAYNYNALFSINLETGNVVLESYFFQDGIENERLVGSMLEEQGRIYFTSVLSKFIYAYDYIRGNMQVIKCRDCLAVNEPDILTMYSMVLKAFGHIYLLPATADNVLKVHKDDTYETAVNAKEKYSECIHTEYSYFSDAGFYEWNGSIYIPMEEKPILAEWEREKMDFHVLPNLEKGIVRSFGHGNRMYLFTYDGQIAMLDLESVKIIKTERVNIQEEDINKYRAAYYTCGEGYFLSYQSNDCIKFQLEYCHAEITTNEKEWGINSFSGEIFCFSYANEENIYFVSNFNRLAIVRGHDTRIITLKYDFDHIMRHMTKRITNRNGNEIITEYNAYDLELFLENSRQNSISEEKKHCGTEIYDYLKGLS